MERTAASTSSTEAPPAGWVALGRIVAAHGLRGQLRVRYFAAGPENLLRAPELAVAAREGDPEPVRYEVASASPGRAGEVRVALGGVECREAAEGLKGRLVMVEHRHLEPLREGEYYGYQIVGCRVEAEDGRPIGTVREIWHTGAPDVLVVEDEAGAQHLIPAARGLLREVDFDRRRIVIELPPGLLDTG